MTSHDANPQKYRGDDERNEPLITDIDRNEVGSIHFSADSEVSDDD